MAERAADEADSARAGARCHRHHPTPAPPARDRRSGCGFSTYPPGCARPGAGPWPRPSPPPVVARWSGVRACCESASCSPVITFCGTWGSDAPAGGPAGAAVAAGHQAGSSAGVDAAAADRRHTVADPDRRALARRAGTLWARGTGSTTCSGAGSGTVPGQGSSPSSRPSPFDTDRHPTGIPLVGGYDECERRGVKPAEALRLSAVQGVSPPTRTDLKIRQRTHGEPTRQPDAA